MQFVLDFTFIRQIVKIQPIAMYFLLHYTMLHKFINNLQTEYHY
jgi:hypothetical protein